MAALAHGLPPAYLTPQSRLNTLDAAPLMRAGYDLIGLCPDAGVDLFVKQTPSRFVFVQGHPEYESDTLLREFRRDLAQFAAGERATRPAVPIDYLPAAHARDLSELAAAVMPGDAREAIAACDRLWPHLPARPVWTDWSESLYARWLAMIAAQKADLPQRAAAGV